MTKKETYELSSEAQAAIGMVEAARLKAFNEGVAINYSVSVEEPKPRNNGI